MDPGRFGLTPEAAPRPLTARSVFGNDGPIELEIGCGKGTFLLAESESRPDVNFVGIEYARKYWSYVADRLRRGARENARVVLAEAASFVRDYFEDGALTRIHIYFPDPWPKKRHQKRRLVTPELLGLLASKLAPEGRVQIATDHEGYFAQMQACVDRSPLVETPFDPAATAGSGESVGTNFERKYRREGRAVFTIAARAVPVQSAPTEWSARNG